MTRLALPMALAAFAAGLALPTAAPAQRDEKVVIVYGTDACPTSRSGDEIVVCSRRPESERYRIPSELRDSGATATQQSWAGRMGSVIGAGGDRGPGPCTNVGGGGGNNCFRNQMSQARAEKAADKAAAAASPEPK